MKGLKIVNGAGAGIAVSHSPLVFGYWLLATGYWLLATGYWLKFAIRCHPYLFHFHFNLIFAAAFLRPP
jgi:hypothetical protein